MDAHIVDDRRDLLDELLAEGVAVSEVSASEFCKGLTWRAHDAVVLLSRNAPLDALALRALLALPALPPYLGMIGSRRKVRMVIDELTAEGFSPELLARIHAPIGLDIGADTPAEIAVSILAEILAVHHGRNAGFLKDNQHI
jgi:xanthine dehydrogenase accessory factor